MGIPITGANRQAFDQTNTEAKGGKSPFPFTLDKWNNYTAQVTEIEIVIDEAEGNDQLLVKAENGEYGVRFYFNLDPTRIGPACTNPQEAIQKNVDKLLLVGKALDLITWKGDTPEIDSKRFKNGIGKIVSFGITHGRKQDGSPKISAKGYPVPATVFGGLTKDGQLHPVRVPTGPLATTPASAPQGGYSDDIPF